MARQKTIETRTPSKIVSLAAAVAVVLPLYAGCLRYENAKPVQNQPTPAAQTAAFASWKLERAKRAVFSGAAAMIVPHQPTSAPASEPAKAMPRAEFKPIALQPFKKGIKLTDLKLKAKPLLPYHEAPAARFEQIENAPQR